MNNRYWQSGREYPGKSNVNNAAFANTFRLCTILMNSFKPDHRKSNALFTIGICFSGLSYLALESDGLFMKAYWVILCLITGSMGFCLSIFSRYLIHIRKGTLIISNRSKFFSKRIELQEVKSVTVVNKDYPVGIYNNTLLHLLLWKRKFSRLKQIHLFDPWGKKIFTIDGQGLENKDFDRLVKVLKKK